MLQVLTLEYFMLHLLLSSRFSSATPEVTGWKLWDFSCFAVEREESWCLWTEPHALQATASVFKPVAKLYSCRV